MCLYHLFGAFRAVYAGWRGVGGDTRVFVTSMSDLLRDAGALVKKTGCSVLPAILPEPTDIIPVHLFKRTIYSIIYIKYFYITRNG